MWFDCLWGLALFVISCFGDCFVSFDVGIWFVFVVFLLVFFSLVTCVIGFVGWFSCDFGSNVLAWRFLRLR